MPRPDYRKCRKCGKPASEVGQLSHTRQCRSCAQLALLENVEGMATMTEPALSRWRAGMAASVGAVLVDSQTLGG